MSSRDREEQEKRNHRLEAAVEELQRRVEALEQTLSTLDREVRELSEAEDLGATQ